MLVFVSIGSTSKTGRHNRPSYIIFAAAKRIDNVHSANDWQNQQNHKLFEFNHMSRCQPKFTLHPNCTAISALLYRSIYSWLQSILNFSPKIVMETLQTIRIGNKLCTTISTNIFNVKDTLEPLAHCLYLSHFIPIHLNSCGVTQRCHDGEMVKLTWINQN